MSPGDTRSGTQKITGAAARSKPGVLKMAKTASACIHESRGNFLMVE